jgi:hypothetical protein
MISKVCVVLCYYNHPKIVEPEGYVYVQARMCMSNYDAPKHAFPCGELFSFPKQKSAYQQTMYTRCCHNVKYNSRE